MNEGKKIIYMLIAKGTKPLADYSKFTGDFFKICESIFDKIKSSFGEINLNNGYNIFYLIENDISYLIMAESLFPKSIAIVCIESIKKEFQSTFMGKNFENEIELGLNKEFQEKLKMKYEYYNENIDLSKEVLQQLKGHVEEMEQAFNLLNQRKDEIESMNQKAESLALNSGEYLKAAKKVKKAEKKRKIILYIGLCIIILLIVYFIICAICQSFTFQC